MARYIAPLSALIAAIFLAGLWAVTQRSGDGDQFASCRAAQVAGGAGSIGGPFELVNAAGQTVTDQDVITEPSIIYFGYTFCPDICPLDAARNAEVVDLLAEQGVSATPVFITVDPRRDTPEVVGEFSENLHEKMIGLTGSEEQIKEASAAYRTYFKAHPAEDEFYLVDHSTFSYLVLPEHGFVEFYRREVSASDMADSVVCFVGQS